MKVKSTMAAGRFAMLLDGEAGVRAVCDRPLLDRKDWVAAPTLGAIVPNWLIVVPRQPALNFRSWQEQSNSAPEAIIGELCAHLGLTAEEIIWFEHGPSELGSVVGCGTDYAHLHLLLKPDFTFQTFLDQAISMSQLEWDRTEAERVYLSLPSEASYLVTGSGGHAAWASDVDAVGSQFFRRVVGSLSRRAERWDYKRYPHADNIGQTIETFRNLEGAARRGG